MTEQIFLGFNDDEIKMKRGKYAQARIRTRCNTDVLGLGYS